MVSNSYLYKYKETSKTEKRETINKYIMAILATWRWKTNTNFAHRDLEVRSIKLPSWQKTGFASNVNDMLSRVGIITRTVGVCHQRLLAFGPSLASLTSDLTLILPTFGRPDLASELPLVPRVQFLMVLETSVWSAVFKFSCLRALSPQFPLASHVAQDPMSALRRPFFLAPCFAEVQTLSRARSVYILFIQANPLTLETFILFFGVEIAESGVLELNGR